MVDREVDGPLWVIFGHSWGLRVWSWATLGAGVGGLLVCWRSWVALGHLLAFLARSWGRCVRCSVCWRSWTLLGPVVAVLGCSWGLYWRSGAEKCEEHGYLEHVFISQAEARSAASRAGLGSLLGPILVVLGHFGALC